MKYSILILTSFFAWAIYDHHLLRQRRDSVALTAIELSLEEIETKQKLKRKNLGYIPPHYRKAKKPVALKVNYFLTKPRDVRFSNQRKIRRMFNNM